MDRSRSIAGVAICVCVALTACGQDSDIKNAVSRTLKDPESARFGEIEILDGKPPYACVTVNAKNSMGGYTGDQQAVAMRDDDDKAGWQVVGIQKISHPACIELITKMRAEK